MGYSQSTLNVGPVRAPLQASLPGTPTWSKFLDDSELAPARLPLSRPCTTQQWRPRDWGGTRGTLTPGARGTAPRPPRVGSGRRRRGLARAAAGALGTARPAGKPGWAWVRTLPGRLYRPAGPPGGAAGQRPSAASALLSARRSPNRAPGAVGAVSLRSLPAPARRGEDSWALAI